MNVLSLFDGISCGRVALDRAGIKVDNYYASEIDKHAIAVSKDNWKDIIHIGDVTKVAFSEGFLHTEYGDYNVGKINLVLAGSPCFSEGTLVVTNSGLTPIENERLQTLPDNYTKAISDSQRYKSIGNGWTVDVIAHILKGIRN